MKIIAFNSPPQSGKDEAVSMWQKMNPAIKHIKYADVLVDMIRPLYEGDTDGFDYWYYHHKDEPVFHTAGNPTTRRLLIEISEAVLKPLFGRDVIAKRMVARIKHIIKHADDDTIIVISDCGFQEEYDLLKHEIGAENQIVLVRVDRDGCTFDFDSRYYLNDTPDVTIDNNGSLNDLEKSVKLLLSTIK